MGCLEGLLLTSLAFQDSTCTRKAGRPHDIASSQPCAPVRLVLNLKQPIRLSLFPPTGSLRSEDTALGGTSSLRASIAWKRRYGIDLCIVVCISVRGGCPSYSLPVISARSSSYSSKRGFGSKWPQLRFDPSDEAVPACQAEPIGNGVSCCLWLHTVPHASCMGRREGAFEFVVTAEDCLGHLMSSYLVGRVSNFIFPYLPTGAYSSRGRFRSGMAFNCA